MKIITTIFISLFCTFQVLANNPTKTEINSEIERLACKYRVPSIIIKAICLQESNWEQYLANGTTPLVSPDGGIGLMQVTISNPSNLTSLNYPLGTINEYCYDLMQGQNSFLIYDNIESVNFDTLKHNWKYNLEIGTRMLLGKKIASSSAGDDAKILENWYYTLAYYNGLLAGSPTLGGNNPNNSFYTRTVTLNDHWKNTAKFPYQECIFNIIAQKYTIPSNLIGFFNSPIEVTLPGPIAVSTGDGNYNYVCANFSAVDTTTNNTDPADFISFFENDSVYSPDCSPITSSNVHIYDFCYPNFNYTDQGFRYPLNGTYLGNSSCSTYPNTFCNNGGYTFNDLTTSCNTYHPGEDFNIPSSPGDDLGEPVYAVNDGIVIWASTTNPNAGANVNWGGIVIKHKRNNNFYYSQYGHVQNVTVKLGQTISKGTQIAEIGLVGILNPNYAHLHFELRKENHPYAYKGCYSCGGNSGIGNSSNVISWYEDPDVFIDANSAPTSNFNLQLVNNINFTPNPINYNSNFTLNNITISNNGNASWTGSIALALHDLQGNYLMDFGFYPTQTINAQSNVSLNLSNVNSSINHNNFNPGQHQIQLKYKTQNQLGWNLISQNNFTNPLNITVNSTNSGGTVVCEDVSTYNLGINYYEVSAAANTQDSLDKFNRNLEFINTVFNTSYTNYENQNPGHITGEFLQNYGTYLHKGFDLRAQSPFNVYSPFEGVVIATAGPYGKVCIYNATLDKTLNFQHLSQIDVNVNDTIYLGDTIGMTGSVGAPGQPHLHVGLRDGSTTFLAPLNNTTTTSFDPRIISCSHNSSYNLELASNINPTQNPILYNRTLDVNGIQVHNSGTLNWNGNIALAINDASGNFLQDVGLFLNQSIAPNNFIGLGFSNLIDFNNFEEGSYELELKYLSTNTTNWESIQQASFSNPLIINIELQDIYEVNDTFSQAYDIGSLDINLDTVTIDNSDLDYFKFQANGNNYYFKVQTSDATNKKPYSISYEKTGDLVSIELFPLINSNFDTDLFLYDDAYNQLDYNDNGGFNYFSKIVYNVGNNSAACNTDSYEPNNNYVTASDLTNLSNFNIGSLCISPGDQDNYKISFNGLSYYVTVAGFDQNETGEYELIFSNIGDTLVIETNTFNNSSTDTYLWLSDSLYNTLDQNDDGGNVLFSKISYYANAATYSPYICSGDIYEPNNNFSSAINLGPGNINNVQNLCLTYRDKDFFRILIGGNDYYLEVKGYSAITNGNYNLNYDGSSGTHLYVTTSSSNNSNIDTYISLYDANYNFIMSNDDNLLISGSLFSAFVYDYSTANPTTPTNCSADIREPNNSFSQSYNWGTDSLYLEPNLCLTSNDYDYFKVNFNGYDYYILCKGYDASVIGEYNLSYEIIGSDMIIETSPSNLSDIDTRLFLYDNNEVYITGNDDGGQNLFSKIIISSSQLNKTTQIDFTENDQIKLFPNPTNDIINISVNPYVFNTYSLINISGKSLIKDLKIEASDFNIQLKDYPSGVYYLNLSSEKSSKVIKVIKF